MVLAAEAEHGRRVLERLGEVRQRRDPDPAADEQRPRHVEAEAVPERPEDRDLVAGLERGERARARADRVDQERELAARREAERHRPRQHAAGRLEHEELARDARIEPAARHAQQRVRADRLDARRRYEARAWACLSWSVRAGSASAFSIASTAARATASVVMHGTRATTAASRIA